MKIETKGRMSLWVVMLVYGFSTPAVWSSPDMYASAWESLPNRSWHGDRHFIVPACLAVALVGGYCLYRVYKRGAFWQKPYTGGRVILKSTENYTIQQADINELREDFKSARHEAGKGWEETNACFRQQKRQDGRFVEVGLNLVWQLPMRWEDVLFGENEGNLDKLYFIKAHSGIRFIAMPLEGGSQGASLDSSMWVDPLKREHGFVVLGFLIEGIAKREGRSYGILRTLWSPKDNLTNSRFEAALGLWLREINPTIRLTTPSENEKETQPE